MNKRILRWEIPIDGEEYGVGASGNVVAAEALNSEGPWMLSFWTVETDQDAMAWIERSVSSGRRFTVVGTGQLIPRGWVHRVSAPRKEGLVWHLLEQVP